MAKYGNLYEARAAIGDRVDLVRTVRPTVKRNGYKDVADLARFNMAGFVLVRFLDNGGMLHVHESQLRPVGNSVEAV